MAVQIGALSRKRKKLKLKLKLMAIGLGLHRITQTILSFRVNCPNGAHGRQEKTGF